LNKDKPKKEIGDGDSDSDNDQDLTGFGSKNLSKDEKAKRAKELEELKAKGQDTIAQGGAGAIRLPNRVSKGLTIDPNTGTAK